jgi:serine/threonine-protein kinase
LVASKGYVAIDFYDGSIMYDFAARETTICDIDFYQKAPCQNMMGRLWGSQRFMAPEEYQLGAAIDGVTNVYTMGATAFELLGDNRQRTLDRWQAGAGLFAVASRATSADRSERYPSIAALSDAWEEALKDEEE